MIREQSVSVHEVQVALIRVRTPSLELIDFFGCLQTQQVVEPLLNGVVVSVSDGLIKGHLLELSACREGVLLLLELAIASLSGPSVLLSQLIDQLK